MCTRHFNSGHSVTLRSTFKQRGQSMVLWALLISALMLFVGLGMDLGWYYLNVSRLQNAADAAALAGAQEIIKQESFSKYNFNGITLVEVNSFLTSENKIGDIDKADGDDVAAEYVKKNLSSDDVQKNNEKGYIMNDEWNSDYDSKVTMKPPELYKTEDTYYYVVHLEENIQHFLLSGWFDDMPAPVLAVARISKSGSGDGPVTLKFDANGGKFTDGTTTDSKSLDNPKKMEDDAVSEPISSEKGKPTNENKTFLGWSTTKTPSEGEIITYIPDGKQLTKTEMEDLFGDNSTVVLYAIWKDNTPETTKETTVVKPHNNKTLWEQMQYLIAKNVYNDYWYAARSKYNKRPINTPFVYANTYYNNNTHAYYAEVNTLSKSEIDNTERYYIDFLQTHDSVLQAPDSEKNNKYGSGVKTHNYGNLRRVHSLLNVNDAYTVRSSHKKDGKKIDDDPIYFRFEAEPYISEYTPIRQIVININVSNLDDDKRPLFFFYDGPDARPNQSRDGSGQPVLKPKDAQPVILNLNADFKGVLFIPDIPVVINGNGHIFEGFVIASEYRYLNTRGTKVKYSITGEADKDYSDNKIYVDANTGNVNSIVVTTTDTQNAPAALNMWNENGISKFNLHSNSRFRQFHIEDNVNYMYVFYDYSDTPTMDETPFHEYFDTSKPLMPLYNAKGKRITKWAEVKLYDKPKTDGTRQMIPKTLSGNQNKGTVRLDSNGSPLPLYDEAGNPVYFCEDYVLLTGSYEILTLDTVTEGKHGDPTNSKEFLLVKTDTTNVSDTDDWK